MEGGDIPFSEPIPVVKGMGGSGGGVNPTQAPWGDWRINEIQENPSVEREGKGRYEDPLEMNDGQMDGHMGRGKNESALEESIMVLTQRREFVR